MDCEALNNNNSMPQTSTSIKKSTLSEIQPNSLNNKTYSRLSKRKSRTKSVQSMDDLLKNLLDEFENNLGHNNSKSNLQVMASRNLSKSVCDVSEIDNKSEVVEKVEEKLSHDSIYTFMDSLPMTQNRLTKYSTLPRFPIKVISPKINKPVNEFFDNRNLLTLEDESCYEEVNIPESSKFIPPLPNIPSNFTCSSSSFRCNSINVPKCFTMRNKNNLPREDFFNKTEMYAQSCIKNTTKAIDKIFNKKKRETVNDGFCFPDENEHELKSIIQNKSSRNNSIVSMTPLEPNKISSNHAVRARTLSNISSLNHSFGGSKSDLSVSSRASSFTLNNFHVSKTMNSSEIFNKSSLLVDHTVFQTETLGEKYRNQRSTKKFFIESKEKIKVA